MPNVTKDNGIYNAKGKKMIIIQDKSRLVDSRTTAFSRSNWKRIKKQTTTKLWRVCVRTNWSKPKSTTVWATFCMYARVCMVFACEPVHRIACDGKRTCTYVGSRYRTHTPIEYQIAKNKANRWYLHVGVFRCWSKWESAFWTRVYHEIRVAANTQTVLSMVSFFLFVFLCVWVWVFFLFVFRFVSLGAFRYKWNCRA